MSHPSVEEIEAKFMPRIGAEEGVHRQYEYRAPNGRRFDIRECAGGDKPFFLEELKPSGRVWYPATADQAERFVEDPRVKAATQSPNDMSACVQAMGIDPDKNLLHEGGLGSEAGRRYRSRRECAEQIKESLDSNTWYDHVDHALLEDPEYQARIESEYEAAWQGWKARQAVLRKKSMAEPDPLFRGLHAMARPISADCKQAIRAYLDHPTEQCWKQIYSTHIRGVTTLWQAWAEVEPHKAPVSKPAGAPWPRIPSAEVLRKAMRAVAEAD